MTSVLSPRKPELEDFTEVDALKIESDFFAALKGGPNQLEAFYSNWASINDSLKNSTENLSTGTLNVLYSLASTIGEVAANMLQCQRETDSLYEEMRADMSSVLESGTQDLTIDDDRMNSLPAYIEPSHAWLVANLHNPYPSAKVREQIACQSGCRRNLIDNWFVDARKRIGWNNLRKTHFSNRRADIVDAATRFWCKEDPSRPLCHAVENKFVSIQAAAQNLYAGCFSLSTLASKLDSAVLDMTSELGGQSNQHKSGRRWKEPPSELSIYPTPENSPGTTPEPLSPSSSIAFPSEIEQTRGSKRRRSSDSSLSQSSKRIRANSPPPHSQVRASATLPSPASSVEDIEDASPASAYTFGAYSPNSISSSRKRKRCSSTASEARSPKRRDAPSPSPSPAVLSVVHPTSDINVQPIAASTTNWLDTFLGMPDIEMPPPVVMDSLDASVPLEIELTSFPSFGYFPPQIPMPSQSTSIIAASSATITPAEMYLRPCSETQGPPSSSDISWLDAFPLDLGNQQAQVDPSWFECELLWNSFMPQGQSLAVPNLTEPQLLGLDPDPNASLKEAKTRELLALEAQLHAVRAELHSIS